MYPTMAMKANADNFALRLTFVEEHLIFVKADYILVSGLSGDRMYMSWSGIDTAKSVSPDGTLLWTGKCDFMLASDLVTRGTSEYLFAKVKGGVSSA